MRLKHYPVFEFQLKTCPPDLAEVLLNIPSAAAFIERYYSFCGNICKTKSGNMGTKTNNEKIFIKSKYSHNKKIE